MKVSFDTSFYKRLVKISDKSVLEKVKQTILFVEQADDLLQIVNLKKMEGFKTFYRIRIGDYRVGIELKKRYGVVYHSCQQKRYLQEFSIVRIM